MDRGTYASASSGVAQLKRLEIVNNNLANINTPGFKRQVLVTDEQSFDQTLAKQFEGKDPYARGDHDRTAGVTNVRSVVDFAPGPIKNTGNPLDVALRSPNQFFAVNTPEGEQYTRAGTFTLDAEGQLVTPDGFPVASDGGTITVTGPGAHITSSGDVVTQGQQFGRLKVVEITDTANLAQVGGNRFKLNAGTATPVTPSVETASLEMSNVSAVSSIIDMISANRGFDIYTKTAQSIDQINQAAISQVGRSR